MFVDRSVPRISQAHERFAFARELEVAPHRPDPDVHRLGRLPSHLDANVVFRLLTMGLLGAAMMRLSARLTPGENADSLARDVLAVSCAGCKPRGPLESTFVDADCLPDEHPAAEKAS
jgi:hypothetical protein